MKHIPTILLVTSIMLQCRPAGGAASAPPTPADLVVRAWDFDDGTAQGWSNEHDCTPLQATGGVVRTRATGPDAWLGVALDGVAASNVTHLVVRMRSNQSGVCQVYYATDRQSQYAQPFVPTFDCPGDNVFREFVVALDELWSHPGMLRYVRLDPVNSAGGEAAEIELDEIRLVDKPACPLATSFAPERAWVRRGERVTLRMEIMNVGGGTMPPLDVRLRTAHGPGLPGTLMADPRGGAARQVYTWVVQPQQAGLQRYQAELVYAGRAPALVETLVLTVAPDAVPAPSGRRACARTTRGAVLETPLLSLALVGDRHGVGAAVMRTRAAATAAWHVAGVCLPLARVMVRDHAATYQLTPRFEVRHTTSNAVQLVAVLPHGLGRVHLQLSIGARATLIDMQAALEAGANLTLLRFGGPVLLAGEGSFGARKAGALFPGLEYLEGPQRSSDTDGVGELFGLRLVPKPCEIAVPLMAVGDPQGGIIGVMWNATQQWDGSHMTPMAEFASPNFADQQDNHLLANFVPTWPVWVAKNMRVAGQPYGLHKGAHSTLPADDLRGLTTPYLLPAGARITLATALFALPAARMVDVVPFYYDVYGLPAHVVPARSLAETFALCMQGWAQTCYDARRNGFVAHWRFNETHRDLPPVRAALLAYARETGDPRWLTAVGMTTNSRVADLVGPLHDGFTMLAPLAAAALASQRPDGSWGYHAEPAVRAQARASSEGTRDSLGREGESNIGICAVAAINILEHAKRTGETNAIAAGLKALEAMLRFSTPAGAQVWEVQMDAPDIYAAALAADCFRIGYELTGAPRYLDAALYWARTGLPFLYAYQVPGTGPDAQVIIPDDPATPELEAGTGLFASRLVLQNPDRQVTPWASLAVFGSTYYSLSWFAHAVQWCGLCWANAVYDLLPYTNDVVLAHAADGVLLSACQQTMDNGPVIGTLPDSWHLDSNTIYPIFISPMRVEDTLRKKLDKPNYGTQRTVILRTPQGGRYHVTSRGGIYNATAHGRQMTWSQRYLAGEPCDTVVVGWGNPRAVTVDGRPLAQTADPACAGWQFDEARRLLCLRVPHHQEYHTITITR